MKFVFIVLISQLAYAQYGQLSKEEQKYFRNDSLDGKNHLDRIDDNVRQINKLMGEMESLKRRVEVLEKKLQGLSGTPKNEIKN